MPTTSNRHETILALTAAAVTRIQTYCTGFKAVLRRQTTDRKGLIDLIVQTELLPAAVVLLGPIDYDGGLHPGMRKRDLELGILAIAEYDAAEDAAGLELWALLDSLDVAFMPLASRGENEGQPIALVGNQSGSGRGVIVYPAGSIPVDAGPDRAAALFTLTCVDPVMSRTTA